VVSVHPPAASMESGYAVLVTVDVVWEVWRAGQAIALRKNSKLEAKGECRLVAAGHFRWLRRGKQYYVRWLESGNGQKCRAVG